jgi:hypothetical protein
VAVVESLAQIQALDPKIRGLLGGSFLGHFDVLIDNASKLLCLDETKQMRQDVQGQHVAVTQQSGSAEFALSASPFDSRTPRWWR